jgi:hypothetical protein
MEDDLRRLSDALGVPLPWLLGAAFAAMAVLLAAMSSGSWAVTGVAVASGVVIALVGVRAALRPSRPFRLQKYENPPWLNTTRRLGLFYVVAGFVWALIAVMAAAHVGASSGH